MKNLKAKMDVILFPWVRRDAQNTVVVIRLGFLVFFGITFLFEERELLKSLFSLQLIFCTLGIAQLGNHYFLSRRFTVVLTGVLLFPWVVLVVGGFSFIERVALRFQGDLLGMLNVFLSFDFTIPLILWPITVYVTTKYEYPKYA